MSHDTCRQAIEWRDKEISSLRANTELLGERFRAVLARTETAEDRVAELEGFSHMWAGAQQLLAETVRARTHAEERVKDAEARAAELENRVSRVAAQRDEYRARVLELTRVIEDLRSAP